MEQIKYVLVGFNRDNSCYDILETGSLLEIKNILIETIKTTNNIGHNEYPYKTDNNQPYDWLEIYKENEIGELDKRVCYTKFNCNFKMFEIKWL